MAIIYIGMVLVILLLNIDQIVPMIGTIIKSAFGFEQVTGGARGAAILQGIKRGLFSNEAVWVLRQTQRRQQCHIQLNKV